MPMASILAISGSKSSLEASSMPMRAGPKFLFVFFMYWMSTRSSEGPMTLLMNETITPGFCGNSTMK